MSAADPFEDTLRAELARAVALKSQAMAALIVLGTVPVVAGVLIKGQGLVQIVEGPQVMVAFFLLVVAFFAVELAAGRHIRRCLDAGVPLSPKLGLQLVTVEALMPTIGLGLIAAFLGGAPALTAPQVLLYALMTVASALHLDPRLCLWSGALSAAGYAALSGFLLSTGRVDMALEAEPVTHLMRGTYLFATGVAAALLAWQVRVRVGVAVRAALDHSRVVGIFGRYLHEDVVDRLINAPDGLRLGGQRRMLTVMMTDLRGFSALSERNPPERVMSLLNHYFGRMIPLILEEGGTIDEILGDAIVVLWNAPLDQPDHATRALRCALRLQVEMETVNAWAAAEGLPALEMGVGLHSGEAVVGNIGAPQRQKYGVVGTTINLAARVESATVGGEVLATLAVIAQVEASALHIGERRSLRPKGASEPLEVASVQGLGDLRLPAPDEALVAVAPRAVTLFLFKGKELDPEPIVAELVALGPQAVAVRCAAPLDGQSDVLLRIEPGVEAAARVRPRPDGALLRLTSAESARQVHKALASP